MQYFLNLVDRPGQLLAVGQMPAGQSQLIATQVVELDQGVQGHQAAVSGRVLADHEGINFKLGNASLGQGAGGADEGHDGVHQQPLVEGRLGAAQAAAQ